MGADKRGCDSCKEDHQVMGLEPPCFSCIHQPAKPENIMVENIIPLEIFMLIDDQWRAGFGGAFALDGNIALRMIDEDKRATDVTGTYKKIKTIARAFIQEMNSRRVRS